MIEPVVSTKERLRTGLPRVRSFVLDGTCAVVIVDLVMYAVAGPCGPKPDVFDLIYLAIACVLLALQATIIGLAASRSRSRNVLARTTWRSELWYGLLIFAVLCLQVAVVRFPFTHPGCS